MQPASNQRATWRYGATNAATWCPQLQAGAVRQLLAGQQG